MPPLDNDFVGLHFYNIARYLKYIKGIGCIDKETGSFNPEGIIGIVPLFLLKEKFRVLHLIGDHGNIMLFTESTIHKTCIVGYSSLKRIYGADKDPFV